MCGENECSMPECMLSLYIRYIQVYVYYRRNIDIIKFGKSVQCTASLIEVNHIKYFLSFPVLFSKISCLRSEKRVHTFFPLTCH